MESMTQDLRLALSHIRRHKGLSLVALFSLTLGIGANSALFNVVKSVLLDPLPYPDPESLVFVWETRGEEGEVEGTVSPGNFQGWRDALTSADGLAAIQRRPYNLTSLDEPVRVDGLNVSPGLLSILGVPLSQGREFVKEEETPDATPVCLLSHDLWERHFGRDAELRRKSLMLDGVLHQIVGVLPEAFSVPGFSDGPQVLTPLILDTRDPAFRANHNLVVIGRLTRNTTLARAGSELDRIAAGLRGSFPEWNDGRGARLRPVKEQLVQPVRQSLWFLFGAVGLVLFMTCVNLTSLFLARTALAEKEMAVRKALGCMRSRLIRPIVLEALTLSLLGGALGMILCGSAVRAIRSFGPVAVIPRLASASVDLSVFGFTLLCAVATALLFGLVPALRSSRVNVKDALQEIGRQPGLSGQHRIQEAFVIGQVCLSVVLLIASGLLLRTYQKLLQADLGFEPTGRVAMMVSLPERRYGEPPRVRQFLDQTLERVDAIPGVVSAGASIGLPFNSLFWRQFATVEGRPAPTLPEVPVADLSIVTPGYIETLGVSLVEGRSILPADGGQDLPVALVNEEFARRYLGSLDPLGQRLRLAPPDDLVQSDQQADRPWRTIVGVVENVRRRALETKPEPEVLIPQAQDRAGAREFFIVVSTLGSVGNLGTALREAVWQTDPDQPVAWVAPITGLYSDALAQQRFNLALVGGFGVTGLILALVGVYGLMANTVSLRTREIGVRVALGAAPRDILRQVVGWGAMVTGIGLGLGLVVSLLVSRLMQSMIIGVHPTDLPTYLTTTLLVGTAGCAAVLRPALRASRADPQDLLTQE